MSIVTILRDLESRKISRLFYATEGTINCILNNKTVGKVDSDLFNVIKPDRDFSIKDIELLPLHISHDAADPVCYRFFEKEKSWVQLLQI